MTLHRTYCRYCTASCGLVVEVDGDTVVSVRGDPEDPDSSGYTCVKGRSIDLDHHSASRLADAWLGSGPGRRASSTAEVVEDLGVRLGEIRDRFGPGAIGAYLGTSFAKDTAGKRAFSALISKIGSPNLYTSVSIDAVPKTAVQGLITGTGFTAIGSRVIDDECKLVLIFGGNPVVSHGRGWANPIARVRELTRTGEVWVIDPRLTETGRLATRHLAPRAGTDYAVLAYLVREILREGADRDYLARHATDVEVLREVVEPFTVTFAAERCGMEPTELSDLLAAVRRAGRFAAITGVGLTMSKAPCVAEWLMWCLQIATGSLERSGGNWFVPDFYGKYDREPFTPRAVPPSDRPPTRPELPSWGGERPSAALGDEILAGNIRALIVAGGNPVVGFPGAAHTTRALAALDVLAVADIGHTATTGLATHLIPVTGQLDRSDLHVAYYRYTARVLEPIGDRWPAWRVAAKLGQQLGVDVLPGGLDPDTCTEYEVVTAAARGATAPIAPIAPDGPTVLADEATLLEWTKARGAWATNLVLLDGRWQLAPRQLLDQLAELVEEPAPPIVLVPLRQRRHVNSKLVGLVTHDGKQDLPFVIMHPDDGATADLSAGDLAEVTSESGRLAAEVRFEEGIRKGTVSIPHGFDEPNVNRLTSAADDADPVSGMPRFSGIPVRVCRLLPTEVTTPRQ